MPPGGPLPAAGHWRGSTIAEAVGIGVNAVQRVWCTHCLQPHWAHWFKLLSDPQFAARLREIVRPHVVWPDRASVLSVNEKSRIQFPDGTQPGLPTKNGGAGIMIHDCKCHGTATLFAALSLLEGQVMAQRMKHRHHPRSFGP